jgi:hypothetical protein
MTENCTPKRNPYLGIDCPPWCTWDHAIADQFTGRDCVGSGGSIGDVWTRALLAPHHTGNPVVAVTGTPRDQDGTYHVELSPDRALHLAGLVELLADAAPGQHRLLAAAIRKAAADITEADQ